jgi:hypothetical protein
MANSLGALVVSLSLDAADYIKGLTKAEYEAQKFAKAVESTVEAARASMVALGVGAAGVAVALNDQISKIADYQDLADKIGDTAEAIGSLSNAANVSGVSLDTVAAASIKLTASLSKTDDEAKGAGAAITALGLNFQQFKDLSPVDQIEAVANALNKFEDGANKTAVAVSLFGKSGADLLPFLFDLADGSERQVKITQEQIEAADSYAKQVARLQGSLAGLTKQMAAESIPVMSRMVEQAQELVNYVKQSQNEYSVFEGVLAAVQVVFETIVIVASDVIFVLKGIGTEFYGIGRQIAALATGDIEKFSAIGDAMKADAAKARAELDKFQADFLNRTKEIKQISETNKPKLEFSQVSTDAIKEQTKAVKDLNDQGKEWNDWLSKIMGQTESGRLEKQRAEMVKLSEALKDELISEAEYLEAVNVLLKDQGKELEKNDQFADKLGLTFASSFESAIIQGKSLSDVFKGLTQDILQMIIRMQVTIPLANALSASMKSSGFSFSSLFGGSQYTPGSDSFVGPLPDGARASGGPVSAGSSYLVGENGPEILQMGANAGHVFPNSALGGGGGAVTVNVINQGSQMQVTGQSSRQNSDGSTTIDVMIAAVESGLADRMGAGVGSLFQATNSRFVPQGAM